MFSNFTLISRLLDHDKFLFEGFLLRLQDPVLLLDAGIVVDALSFLALLSLLAFFLASHRSSRNSFLFQLDEIIDYNKI